MSLLREVIEGSPVIPDGGWNVGHLANLGVLLSCDGFSIRLDIENLNKLFDAAEDDEVTEIRDHAGRAIDVEPSDDGLILIPLNVPAFSTGLLLDLDALKELGIEQYEEQVDDDDEPDSEYDPLEDHVTMNSSEFDALEEGIKRAYRRVGKKIKRGFRVTSGFRKGRVVSSASGAFKPRKKASTRMKLRIAARKKKIIRVLKGKRTKRKASSKRLVQMNKRIK